MIARRKKARRPGAATTEFALVVPLFFAFILAMIEIGRGMMVVNLMQHSARTACRHGIVSGTSTARITSAGNDAMKNQGLQGVIITVKVNGTVKEASTAASGDRLTVIVSAPIASNTWLPFTKFLSGNLSGQYSLARE